MGSGMIHNRRTVHAICTLHRQWLPGDSRGWRSRQHRRHSSGDYRNPPPPEEHAGLRRWVNQRLTGDPKFLLPQQLGIVGSAFLFKLIKMQCAVSILSCSATHLHVLYESRADDAMIELGRAKQYSSYKLRHPSGRLWAAGGKIIRPNDQMHVENIFGYLDNHARKESAWVWRHDRDPLPSRDDIDALIAALNQSRG
ncbi:MAG: hypothetical protein EA377_06050 [Phycisphaerales bacterium]|nr:MAG: hypothetical protein EA377_06050 [Phycisphaerales bacterium]